MYFWETSLRPFMFSWKVAGIVVFNVLGCLVVHEVEVVGGTVGG